MKNHRHGEQITICQGHWKGGWSGRKVDLAVEGQQEESSRRWDCSVSSQCLCQYLYPGCDNAQLSCKILSQGETRLRNFSVSQSAYESTLISIQNFIRK